ncbi:MAG TPA: NAD(P)-binding domain-containing protein, partial [Burkholderiales bacterium]|nr:NAD(P)-binding domain-containing protein [Burkholderiales bacterium]
MTRGERAAGERGVAFEFFDTGIPIAMTPVGVIGLGIMGSAMAANLVRAGFAVHGYDPVPAQRAALKKAGGRPARSAAEVLSRAPTVITSLPSAAALHAVAGELRRKGGIVVETSTLPIDDKL